MPLYNRPVTTEYIHCVKMRTVATPTSFKPYMQQGQWPSRAVRTCPTAFTQALHPMQHMMLTAEACFQRKKHYLRVDFHVVPKADVVDDVVSELVSVKGCKRTESAIHCHILSRQDVVILCAHLVWNLQSIAY